MVAVVVATVAEFSWIRPRYVIIRRAPGHRSVSEYPPTGPENYVGNPGPYGTHWSLC